MRPLLICLVLLCPLLAAAEDEELVEYVSIPKSMLQRIDIELFGDRWQRNRNLEPSKDLRQLLMLSEQEAEDLEALMQDVRKRCTDLTVEHAEVTTGKKDHLVFVVEPPKEAIEDLTDGLDERLAEILGPNRKELFDLVRHGRYNQDRLARTVFGPVFRRGLDQITTVTYQMQEDGGWKRKYQYRNPEGGGGGSSSSSGGDLQGDERALAEAILRRLESEGVDTEPESDGGDDDAADDDGAQAPAGAVEVMEVEVPIEEAQQAQAVAGGQGIMAQELEIERADFDKLPDKAQKRLLDLGWVVREPGDDEGEAAAGADGEAKAEDATGE